MEIPNEKNELRTWLQDQDPPTPASSKERSPRIVRLGPRTRDSCAHQGCIGHEGGSGLTFCMAGAENPVPAVTIPMVFGQLQARPAHGHVDAKGPPELWADVDKIAHDEGRAMDSVSSLSTTSPWLGGAAFVVSVSLVVVSALRCWVMYTWRPPAILFWIAFWRRSCRFCSAVHAML